MLLGVFAIFGIGFLAGWLAQLTVEGSRHRGSWAEAMAVGFGGSLVGGLIGNLVFNDEIKIQPTGLVGSFVGAIVLLIIWRFIRRDQIAAKEVHDKASQVHRNKPHRSGKGGTKPNHPQRPKRHN